MAGKDKDDGRLMAAAFVSSFRNLPKGVQALWDHIAANLGSFKTPPV